MKDPDNINIIQPQQFIQIVEMIPEIVIVMNKDGFIKYANAKGREHLGGEIGPELKYGELIGCKYYDEKKSCGGSHYCDFCEISQLVENTSPQVSTKEIVREVNIFNESVVKRFSISSFNLEETDLIAMMIRVL